MIKFDRYKCFEDFSQKSITILPSFATNYLCEARFRIYTATKFKYRNRLNAKTDRHVQFLQSELGIAKLRQNKKCHKNPFSHYSFYFSLLNAVFLSCNISLYFQL